MYSKLEIFSPHFAKVIEDFDLTRLTQFTPQELTEMLAEHFAAALRQGEGEQQFLERLADLFVIGETVYSRKGFYPDLPGDDDSAFWAKVAKALLEETRPQLKAMGYFVS